MENKPNVERNKMSHEQACTYCDACGACVVCYAEYTCMKSSFGEHIGGRMKQEHIDEVKHGGFSVVPSLDAEALEALKAVKKVQSALDDLFRASKNRPDLRGKINRVRFLLVGCREEFDELLQSMDGEVR